jgi:hypothetical protein
MIDKFLQPPIVLSILVLLNIFIETLELKKPNIRWIGLMFFSFMILFGAFK